MKTVLVVDDEDKLRGLMARILKHDGFEVFEADTCKSAMKRLDTIEEVV